MGLFDWLSSETEQKNEFTPTNFAQSQNYDPRAANFGAFGADNYARGMDQKAGQIDRRAAFQADYGQANQDRQLAMQAREGQLQAGGLMMNRATGATPSIAGMQAQQDMQRAVAGQASMAASARGPAGLALAQQGAANNIANAQAGISGQAQINSAQERLAAEQAAFGAMSGMRGQDYASQGLSAQQAQFQTGMQAQNRAGNDARAMGYAQMGHQALGQEQQGLLQQQGMLAQSHGQGQQLGAGIAGANAATNKEWFDRAANAAQDGIGAMTSDARSKYGAQPIGGLMLSDVTSKVGVAQLGGPSAMSPMSAPAAPSFGGATGTGGMNVMGELRAHSNYGTRFQRDPSGGMMGGGMMLSDDRAKVRDAERQAYLLGRAHGVERSSDFAYGGAPREGEEIVDRDPWQADSRRAEQRPEWLEGYMSRDGSRDAGTHFAAQPEMAGAAGDRMTGQLARGLSPYAYEYKPGMGTPGQKVGPMAQDMASNDVTATAVRQDPQSGLLSIDRDDGLKVALGGVGHLAAKQSQQEEMLRGLLASREEPISDLNYLAHARRQRRGF